MDPTHNFRPGRARVSVIRKNIREKSQGISWLIVSESGTGKIFDRYL